MGSSSLTCNLFRRAIAALWGAAAAANCDCLHRVLLADDDELHSIPPDSWVRTVAGEQAEERSRPAHKAIGKSATPRTRCGHPQGNNML